MTVIKIFFIIQFAASEYRSWMLYYGFPAMQGILPHSFVEHFMLFSEAIWILLQTSPSSSQIDKAEELLDQFCSQFEALYGKNYFKCYNAIANWYTGERYCTANLHILRHFAFSVRHLGPLWCHSCFPFEDSNGSSAIIQVSSSSVWTSTPFDFILSVLYALMSLIK